MDSLGTDFNNTGSVMNKTQLEEVRRKRGECVKCGRKCYKKKFFKMIPITEPGLVENGRCLNCHPMAYGELVSSHNSTRRPATASDLARFTRSQSNLSSRNLSATNSIGSSTGGPGMSQSSRPRSRLLGSRAATGFTRSGGGGGGDSRSGSSVASHTHTHTSGTPPSRPRMAGRRAASTMSAVLGSGSGSGSGGGGGSAGSSSSPPPPLRNIASLQPTYDAESKFLTSPPQHSLYNDEVAPLHDEDGGDDDGGDDGGGRRERNGISNGTTTTATKRRSSHSDVQSMLGMASRVTPITRSVSGDLPTPDDLRGAAQTLSAAKQRGIFTEDFFQSPLLPQDDDQFLMNDTTDHGNSHDADDDQFLLNDTTDHGNSHDADEYEELLVEYDTSAAVATSGKQQQLQQQQQQQQLGSRSSLRSGHSQGDFPDEIDGYAIPLHGILNRGGVFPVSPNGRNNSSRRMGSSNKNSSSSSNNLHRHPYGAAPFVEGSCRTLSSMSSMEDEMNSPPLAIRRTLRGTVVDAVYEESDDRSGPSRSSSRDRSEPNGIPERPESIQEATASVTEDRMSEQEYLLKLRHVKQDFGEVLIILREAISSTLVVKNGLEDLARLQLTPDDHEILADMGATHVIVGVMQAHASSLSVQIWGCGAIWNMSGTARNQVAFVDAGALKVILAAMDRFLDSVDLQEKAIATMSNLGATQGNVPILAETGVIRRVVDAMNKHSEVVSVQLKGCGAVTNLASHDTTFKQQIVECGGGGAVVVAMVMHPKDPYLQEKALRALRNLCANSESNKVELANIGGIDAAISAMQVHRDEVGVQEEGAWTLSNLAGNDDNKAMIGDCGGIDVVIRAMWVHSDNSGVQEWCCRALFTLTLHPQNGEVVLEVGGISAIVNAMQAHVDSPTVQEMGCAVLGNLADTDQKRMRIVDEEALDAIVLAMVLHTDDLQVQERACMVLLRLAIHPNFKSMRAANIPELVQVAAQKFPERCDEPASQFLSALGGGNY